MGARLLPDHHCLAWQLFKADFSLLVLETILSLRISPLEFSLKTEGWHRVPGKQEKKHKSLP